MNCLIEQNGTTIECNGTTHDQLCRTRFGIGLDEYLKTKRAARVKVHNEAAAVESRGVLSGVQRKRIVGILRKVEIFILITDIKGKHNVRTSFMRPIRSLG